LAISPRPGISAAASLDNPTIRFLLWALETTELTSRNIALFQKMISKDDYCFESVKAALLDEEEKKIPLYVALLRGYYMNQIPKKDRMRYIHTFKELTYDDFHDLLKFGKEANQTKQTHSSSEFHESKAKVAANYEKPYPHLISTLRNRGFLKPPIRIIKKKYDDFNILFQIVTRTVF